MRKFLVIPIALSAIAVIDSRPAEAYYPEGAWCAVSSFGRGGSVERCDFTSFEACRGEVIAGNRGFCRQNARWPGWHSNYAAAPRKARKRYRR
jgi:hypothetical protein